MVQNIVSIPIEAQQQIIEEEIQQLLKNLGEGRVEGVAYDTAWVARLSNRYPGNGFEECLTWLRRNQYDDGTWGAPLVHHHDRFISTLAAIVALRENGDSRDERRVQRGEDALWRYVGKLARDDSDTVGFPILAASLAEEARDMGLEVPSPPTRYSEKYRQKVTDFLIHSDRNWHESSLSFSLEALRHIIAKDDQLLEVNNSVSASPSATVAYTMQYEHTDALQYVIDSMNQNINGSVPAVGPIDVFEYAWSIHHLQFVDAISPSHPDVQRVLNKLCDFWNPTKGVTFSSMWRLTEVDDTAACFSALRWGDFPVDESVFEWFETEDAFVCYHHETNPSMSALVRLLHALITHGNTSKTQRWINKVLNTLENYDENGTFWWDKWHSSPYYVNALALAILPELAMDIARTRLTWILRTQNDDGGWGYTGTSTAEETAYCLMHLLQWDKTIERIDRDKLDAAATFLFAYRNRPYPPLWIGKSLYLPYNPVKSAILSALFAYQNH